MRNGLDCTSLLRAQLLFFDLSLRADRLDKLQVPLRGAPLHHKFSYTTHWPFLVPVACYWPFEWLSNSELREERADCALKREKMSFFEEGFRTAGYLGTTGIVCS